jgi:hypothetical protein
MFKTPPCTPSKVYTKVLLSPATKAISCVFCGKKQENADYRRKLVKKDTKTEACKTIEKILGQEIQFSSTDTVCRWCVSSVNNCLTKIQHLKDTYHATQKGLQERYGKIIAKRLVTESPAKDKKRIRSLDLFSGDKENLGVAHFSTDVPVTPDVHKKRQSPVTPVIPGTPLTPVIQAPWTPVTPVTPMLSWIPVTPVTPEIVIRTFQHVSSQTEWHPPMARSQAIQTEQEIPEGELEIWVSMTCFISMTIFFLVYQSFLLTFCYNILFNYTFL